MPNEAQEGSASTGRLGVRRVRDDVVESGIHIGLAGGSRVHDNSKNAADFCYEKVYNIISRRK